MFFQRKGKKSNRIFGNISFVDIESSYKRTSHITKLATCNEFYAFIGSIGKKEQFVAIWSRLPRSYDNVGQRLRHGTLRDKPLW